MFTRCVLLFAALTAVLPAQAHQQWLAPNFFYEPGDRAWLSFDHTFGDRRFRPSSGPGSYYRWWVVGPDGLKRPVPFIFLGKTRTVGEVELENAGTYRLEGAEEQMAWTLIRDDGEEKWHPGSRANFAGADIVRSRTYFNKALTYISLVSQDRAAVAASGDPLEVVFVNHPNELAVGQSFEVRVLASGGPLNAQAVHLFPEGGSAHDEATASCTTDAKGLCSFTVGAAGRFLLVTSTRGDHPKGADTDGFSHSVSVMVEIAASP